MAKGFYVVYIDLKHLGIEEDVRKVAYYDPQEPRNKNSNDPNWNISPSLQLKTPEILNILEKHLFARMDKEDGS